MARCRCAVGSCECNLVAGTNVEVEGDGTEATPWVVSATASAAQAIIFLDNNEVAFEVAGAGLPTEPYLVTAELPWVNPAEGLVGEVLAKKADGLWGPAPPATTAPGLISTGPGVTGDGSAGEPLRVCLRTYDDLKAAANC